MMVTQQVDLTLGQTPAMREGTHRCEWVCGSVKPRAAMWRCHRRTRERRYGMWLCSDHRRMANLDQQRMTG